MNAIIDLQGDRFSCENKQIKSVHNYNNFVTVSDEDNSLKSKNGV